MNTESKETLVITIDVTGMLGWTIVLTWILGIDFMQASILHVMLVFLLPVIVLLSMLLYTIFGKWDNRYYNWQTAFMVYSAVGLAGGIILLARFFIIIF